MNRNINLFFNSTEIRIDNTLLHKFRMFHYENDDKIERMNRDTRRRDNSCNMQRIKYRECNTLFDELKK